MGKVRNWKIDINEIRKTVNTRINKLGKLMNDERFWELMDENDEAEWQANITEMILGFNLSIVELTMALTASKPPRKVVVPNRGALGREFENLVDLRKMLVDQIEENLEYASEGIEKIFE